MPDDDADDLSEVVSKMPRELPQFRPWMLLIPLPVAAVALVQLGGSSWIALGAILGIAAGALLGRRIPARSTVHVLCLDLESKSLRLLVMGRKAFSSAAKIGHPWLTLQSGLGYDVVVARSWDAETRTLTYPEETEYSDAAIMSMPRKYRELVSALVELRDKVADQSLEIDFRAQQRASALVARFDELFASAVIPQDPSAEKPEKEGAR